MKPSFNKKLDYVPKLVLILYLFIHHSCTYANSTDQKLLNMHVHAAPKLIHFCRHSLDQ